MGWIKAEGGEVCEGCLEELEEGEDIYERGKDVYCEGCREEDMMDDESSYDDDDYLIDGVGFEEPSQYGGRSSLRAETEDNPRNLPCPTCGAENALTPLDRANSYQCNRCADRDEGREVY